MSAGPDLTARCHCGAVSLTVARKPSRVAQCNCSLCTAVGWRGVYFPASEVTVSGELHSYVRRDMTEPSLKLFRCAHCGTATHWEPLTPPPHEHMGLNANLFDPAALDEAELIESDGRSRPQ